MSGIERLTTKYDSREDRVKLKVVDISGDIRTFWFTRRLLDTLVAALLKGLEAMSAVSKASGSSATAIQRFSQSAAVERLRTQKKVAPQPRAQDDLERALLVTKITLRRSKHHIDLDLKVDDVVVQKISFYEEALRQWLTIVYSQYQVAKWPDAIWPSWIVAQEDSGMAARLN